jgi:transposase-like protein
METKKWRVIRYSEAFKHQVIKEIEDGSKSLEEARRAYGIGVGSIQNWMKRMGKFALLPRLIRVETPDEKNRIKDLERQIKELKNALADTQVQCLIAESRFEVVCEQQGWDPEEIKKKLLAKPSSKPETKE